MRYHKESHAWDKNEKTCDFRFLLKFFICLMILWGAAAYASDCEECLPMDYTKCPHCMSFVSFWSCPKCFYDNYDRISYCPVCGTPKPFKHRSGDVDTYAD